MVALKHSSCPREAHGLSGRWISTRNIKNFSRAVDEAQEMVQLISGQSNGMLYTGGGTELNCENKYEFFKVRAGRRVFPAEGTCGQRGIPKGMALYDLRPSSV